MRNLINIAVLIGVVFFTISSVAQYSKHPSNAAVTDSEEAISNSMATYLGNEAILVEHNKTKVLFDPFFHNGYNTYQLVPEKIRHALFTGKAPYDDIDVIFISHAHGDHFAAEDLIKFLDTFPTTKLVAPQQAIDKITAINKTDSIKASLVPITLAYQDNPVSKQLGEITFDAVRIPHAGWPQRASVSNLVFRVTLENKITVIHMGDADPDDMHFKPLIDHWDSKTSNTAFPPYWFLTGKSGPKILENRIKANENIGLHVPVKIPRNLIESAAKYFSRPGETYTFQ